MIVISKIKKKAKAIVIKTFSFSSKIFIQNSNKLDAQYNNNTEFKITHWITDASSPHFFLFFFARICYSEQYPCYFISTYKFLKLYVSLYITFVFTLKSKENFRKYSTYIADTMLWEEGLPGKKNLPLWLQGCIRNIYSVSPVQVIQPLKDNLLNVYGSDDWIIPLIFKFRLQGERLFKDDYHSAPTLGMSDMRN